LVSNVQSKKRKDLSSESPSEEQSTPLPGNKKKKKILSQPISTSEITSSQVIDLAQDSDHKNAKAKTKRRKKNPGI
jgi:hypothetical protein